MGFLPPVKNGRIVIRRRKKKKQIWRFKRKKREKSKRYVAPEVMPRKYKDYIQSDFWKRRKYKFFLKFDKKCAICGTREQINVHHMIYSQWGKERDEHLVALCRDHHELFHSLHDTKGNMLKESLAFIDEQQQLFEFPKIF